MQGRWFSTILGKFDNVAYENYEQFMNEYLWMNNAFIVMGKQSNIYGQTQYLYDKSQIAYEDDFIVMVRIDGN